MIGWLIGGLFVAGCWLMGWSICRAVARTEAEEAQRNLLDLLANEVRERADADDFPLGM